MNCGVNRQAHDAALLVNPHDPDGMADALDVALRMDLAERQARWRALWAAIEHRSPVVWGRSFVASLLRATAPAVPRAPRPVVEQIVPPHMPQRMPVELETTTVDPRRLN